MKVVIGQGSCGIATGAKKTESEFLEQIKKHNVDVDLTVTGCVGTCYLESIVDVYDNDGKMIRYVKFLFGGKSIVCKFVQYSPCNLVKFVVLPMLMP